MIKSVFKSLYGALTTGPIKVALKAIGAKYPAIDVFLRKIQVALFDWYLVKPRNVQYRSEGGNQVLFVDVSFLVLEDVKTGIQRVTRSILLQLLKQLSFVKIVCFPPSPNPLRSCLLKGQSP